jgi:hypothetical protein
MQTVVIENDGDGDVEAALEPWGMPFVVERAASLRFRMSCTDDAYWSVVRRAGHLEVWAEGPVSAVRVERRRGADWQLVYASDIAPPLPP